MPFKLNISDKKGKAWRLEADAQGLIGKSIGDIVMGDLIGSDFAGYELEITGGSDRSGLPLSKDVEGIGLKRVLLTKGWGMRKRPRGDKKRVSQIKGLRLRKSVRGRVIAETTIQINMKVLKEGNKNLEEIFSDQNKAPESEKLSGHEASKDEGKEVNLENSEDGKKTLEKHTEDKSDGEKPVEATQPA